MNKQLDIDELKKQARKIQKTFRGKNGWMPDELFEAIKTLRDEGFYYQTIMEVLKENKLIKYKNAVCLRQAFVQREIGRRIKKQVPLEV
jgi:hypothetical protein